jgi:uncharacterized protein DUF6714
MPTDKNDLVCLIREAFRGVKLGDGTSLRQAKIIDGYGQGYSDEQFEVEKRAEITEDWERVPASELELDNIAHLDSEGMRYYLPALMVALLDRYDANAMWTIGTVSAIDVRGRLSAYKLSQLSLLTFEQRSAVAVWCKSMSRFVDVSPDDRRIVDRAVDAYWCEFLPKPPISMA